MPIHFKKRFLIPTIAAAFLFVGSSFQDNFFEVAKQIEIFTSLFKELDTNYVDEINPGELMTTGLKAMLQSLDPYTVYYNEQDVLKFKINKTGEYTGIGALISREKENIVLKEIYKGFPADLAGMKAGDEIFQIGQVKISDYKEEVLDLFRGAKKTELDVQFYRQGEKQKARIVLNEIELKAVPFYSKIDDKTGYIVLKKFNNHATAQTKAAIIDLKSQGVERIVLDLRDNPGGLLSEAVNICNLFVPKNQTIVTTKSKIAKHNNLYKTTAEPLDLEIPLTIIVNGRSASASEIVSGALQDLDRAVILGCRSYGKGLVQRPIDLTYGTQVKVTISKYYTPAGRCIQALDYGNKDKDGKAIRTEEKNYNAFKTKNGRTVYDGGGILPDIEIKDAETSALAKSLDKSDAIFNFATSFYYKNPGYQFPGFTDADYEDFLKFLKKEKIEYKTKTEEALQNALAAAKTEKLDASIQTEYQTLIKSVEQSKDNLLKSNKTEIKNALIDEIIKRYEYEEGLYKYYLSHNTEIKKSVEILNNPDEYAQILKGK
jgi:carboxyl-terminal processing protease